jgi:hypothetical protein
MNPPQAVRSRRVPAAVLLGFGLFIAAVLFWFDPTLYRFYPPCLFYKATGLYCPGCGSLRALHQLLHGHVATAFHFNPLLIASLPVCGGLYLYRVLHKEPGPVFSVPKIIWWCVAIAVLFAIWRNLPGSPLAM